MSEKILVNKYIPKVVPKDLKWYERDGLFTYIDQLKYELFTNDPDKYLEKAEVVNFEMIHNRCRGDPRKFSDKYYQTVVKSDLEKNVSKREKESCCCLFEFREKRYFCRKKVRFFPFFR